MPQHPIPRGETEVGWLGGTPSKRRQARDRADALDPEAAARRRRDRQADAVLAVIIGVCAFVAVLCALAAQAALAVDAASSVPDLGWPGW